VVLEKTASESDFGIHILDSQPAFITQVDSGSAAERAGVEEGQILVAVNGTNVLQLSHYDIVTLISNCEFCFESNFES
jgi:predicted metalloprotease with PDZ domain